MQADVKLLAVAQESPSVRTYRFERPEGFSFTPGQFVMIWNDVVKTHADIALRRAMSIASGPDKPYIEFCIATGTETGLSYYMANNAKPGDVYHIEGPYGKFTLSPIDRETLFIAGGTGIAPIRSMLQSIQAQHPLWLFFGFRTAQDFLYKSEIEQLPENIRVFPIISRTDSGWEGERGYVQELMKKIVGSGVDKELYVCGPPALVRDVLLAAQEVGFPPERVHREQW